MAWTLKQLAVHVDGQVRGDDTQTIESVATLASAQAGQISFLTNPHYKFLLTTTHASAVILDAENAIESSASLLIVKNPHAAYAKIAQLLYPPTISQKGVDPSARIADSAQIGKDVSVGPNVVIEAGAIVGDEVSIGANSYIGVGSSIGTQTIIYPLVSIRDMVRIGERCILHSGCVIGADGFGQAYDNGRWLKVPQIGGVDIGSDVEIGASTTIDRGAIENTVIEDGVKLDNQIQIAHNVRIGANSVLAACCAIAGSTRIGKNAMFGGMVGIAGHLEITDNVMLTAMSMVTRSIDKPGSYSSGIPSEPSRIWRRYVARFKRLDSMASRLSKIEKLLNLEKKD